MAVHLCECGFGCLTASLHATGKLYSAFNPDSSTVPYVTDFLLLSFGSVIPQLDWYLFFILYYSKTGTENSYKAI